MAQLRKVEGEYQWRVNYEGNGMQKSDSFVYEVTSTGLKIFGLLNGAVLDLISFEFADRKVLEAMFKQKIMRVELVQKNKSVVMLLAINKRCI